MRVLVLLVIFILSSCVSNEGTININSNTDSSSAPNGSQNTTSTISVDQMTYNIGEDETQLDISFTISGNGVIGGSATISSGDSENFELTKDSFVGDEQSLIISIRRTGGNPGTTSCVVSINYTDNTSQLVTINADVPQPISSLGDEVYPDPDPNDDNIHGIIAYSVRRIIDPSIYNGPLFKAIRDGDNQEQDFGSNQNSINSAELQSWITGGGGSNAYIVTWYDQSGAQEHFHQSSHSNRPQLIADCSPSGVSAFPCIRFRGDELRLDDPSSAQKTRLNISSGIAIFLGIRFNSVADHIVLANLYGGNFYQFLQYSGYYYYGTGEAFFMDPKYNEWTIRSIMELSNNTNSYAYQNGVLLSNLGNILNKSNNHMLHTIGLSGNASDFDVTEFIIINSEISRETSSEDKHGEIVSEMMNFYGI